MFFKFADIGVNAAGKLIVVALIDGSIIHIPTGQILRSNINEDIVFIFHNGFMDSALHKGLRGDNFAVIDLR